MQQTGLQRHRNYCAAAKRATGILVFSLALAGCGSEDLDSLEPDAASSGPVLWEQTLKTGSSTDFKPLLPFGGLSRGLSGSETRLAILDTSGLLKLSGISGALESVGLNIDGPTELLSFMGPHFSWVPESRASSSTGNMSFSLQNLSNSHRVERSKLFYQGIPVHLAQAISLYNGEHLLWMNARMPEWAALAASGLPADEPIVGQFALTGDHARESYASSRGWSLSVVGPAEPIWLLTETGLSAAFQLIIASLQDGTSASPAQPLKVLMSADSGALLEELPLAFHLTGSARIFRENDVASAREGMALVDLPELNGNGERLSHPLFDVKNCNRQVVSSRCSFPANSAAGDYTSVQYEDPRYDEVTAYFALTRAMAWYRSLMQEQEALFPGEKTWAELDKDFGLGSGKQRLTVYVRAQTARPGGGFTPDNAVYLPAGSDGLSDPEILVGTGWEATEASVPRGLQYLGKDSDVSMHEFGHHVIFRAITEIKGQSLAMHEGFADYFTYAITGNNMLAESVVSAGGALRSGSRRGTLQEFPPESTPAHLSGEFWSSVLWDVRVQLGPWVDDRYKFDKILWHAIDLMRSNETYYGAITAMSQSAQSFAETVGEDPILLKEKIFNVFHARGFLSEPQDDGTLPPPSELLASSNPSLSSSGLADNKRASSASPGKKSSERSGGGFGLSCAVGAHSAPPQPLDLGTLLLLASVLLAPFAMTARPPAQPLLAKSRARRRREDPSPKDHNIFQKNIENRPSRTDLTNVRREQLSV
jgi:hypothetical protein